MIASNPWARLEHAASSIGEKSSDFDLNPDVKLPRDRNLRAAAVLMAFQARPDGLHLYLTKRSSALAHHPGQIAFPGGKQDPGDTGPEDAALREAEEEIGLPRRNVEILGSLPGHETVTNFFVTPVLARITTPFVPRPEPGEVDEVFTVPLSHVADSGRYKIEARRWRGMPRYYYTVPFGPYYIWGATARMLRGLADRLAEPS